MARRDYRSIYVFLILQITFFFLQVQSSRRFVEAFSLTRDGLMHGEIWRLLSFQFVTAPAFGSAAIGLFFTLLIFYIFGGAIEEVWGTANLLAIFVISTVASALFGLVTGVPLLGGFFFEYVLLFVFAHMYPEHVFYVFLILPLKVKWIALIAGIFLVLGLIRFDPYSIAAAIGAGSGFGYYYLISRPSFGRALMARSVPRTGFTKAAGQEGGADAERNLERYRSLSAAIEDGDDSETARRIDALRPGVVSGVNICPPVDYKPEASDRYCIQCEGFNECTIRDAELKLREPGKEAESASAG